MARTGTRKRMLIMGMTTVRVTHTLMIGAAPRTARRQLTLIERQDVR
jgi:hypothetical protein